MLNKSFLRSVRQVQWHTGRSHLALGQGDTVLLEIAFHFQSAGSGVPFTWKLQGTVGGIWNILKMAFEASIIVYKARSICQL